jgi:maltose alpha-D-glucosyltransferase/alpha-amylase
MQWTPDRNAGFSGCDPGRIYLPVIMDPVYGYQAVNVEAQSTSSQSLLNWTRRMIHVRREHSAFGLGEFTELSSSNPSVLAYRRSHVGGHDTGDDLVICVNNLSRFPQPVELDLSEHEGRVPVELTGGVHFPPIGELPYLLTLPGHSFYWFQIVLPDPGREP